MANFSVVDKHCLNDHSFGPIVQGCANDFDFTLFFEEIFFSLIPCALFLLSTPTRLYHLRRVGVKTRKSAFLVLKLISLGLLAVLQLALLVLYAIHANEVASFTPSAYSVAFISTLALTVLSCVEHTRTIRPSTLITVFLGLTVLFDAARVRSLWLRTFGTPMPALASCVLAIKFAVLTLELREKRAILKNPFSSSPPESTASLPNRAVFWWINPLLVRGTRTVLAVGDLWEIDSNLFSRHLSSQFHRRWTKASPFRKNSLLLAVFRTLMFPILQAVIPRLLLSLFQYSQPLLISKVTDIIEHGQQATSSNARNGLIGAAALIYVGAAISTSLYKHSVYRAIIMVRGMLVSAIYEKSLKLSILSVDGKDAITLANTDVDRISNGMQNMHEIWANVIELGFAVYLLQIQIGVACIAPVALAIACTLASMSISGKMSKYQAGWNQAVQRRVSAITATLTSIKNVKFSSMSQVRQDQIHSLRQEEVKQSKKFRSMIAFMNVISNTPAVVSPAVTFTIVAFDKSKTSVSINKSFAALAIITLLCSTVASLLSSIPAFFSTFGCFQRIQDFLESQESAGTGTILASSQPSSAEGSVDKVQVQLSEKEAGEERHSARDLGDTDSPRQHLLGMQNVDSSNKEDSEPILRGLNVRILPGTLTLVLGRVASGKSFFLKTILGETVIQSGTMSLNSSSIAYCAQNLWLPSKSIKDTILGETILDQKRYAEAVEACMLVQDFSQLTDGDETMITTGGANLSGGQKQRIALCRALYSRKEVLILDNVLSGLDETTCQLVVERVFGPKGICRQARQTVILTTHSVHFSSIADHLIVLESGKILDQGQPSSIEISTASSAKSSDSKAAKLSSVEAHHDDPQPVSEVKEAKPMENPVKLGNAEDHTRRTGDMAIYLYYLRTIGWIDSLSFIGMACIYVFLFKFPQIWLKWWVEGEFDLSRSSFVGIYFLLAAVCLLAVGTTIGYYFVCIVPRFILKFHTTLLTTVMSAPLAFLSASGSGSLVNRFSQDIQLIDMSLPSATFVTFFGVLFCLSEMILICLGSKYIAAIIPLGLLFAYAVQKFYLLTSRQLRYLELEAKAPLYTSMIDTLQTLETARAFGWQEPLRTHFLDLLDRSQQPYYLLLCIQRWLTVVLDLFVAAVAVILVAFSVQLKDTPSAGAVGVALVNVLSFNQSIANLVLAWTTLETSLGSIARLRAFVESTPAEPQGSEGVTIARDWPLEGRIRLAGVSAAYSQHPSRPVLDDISLDIHPGEHVAIRGRTGSGKSTLLSLLLRLHDPSHGTIEIDGVPIDTIPPRLLRQRLIGVSQDAIHPLGTLRAHLDPEKHHADATILSVLARFRLARFQALLDDADAADTQHMSGGEAQLLALVRAVLRRRASGAARGVLLLDEATSMLDGETEDVAVGVLAEEFRGWTVLSVGHRRRLWGYADRVVTVREGRVGTGVGWDGEDGEDGWE